MTVTVDRLTGVYKNMTRGIVALVFRCSPIAGTATATHEAAEVRWMSLDDVVNVMDPAYAVRITDAFESVTQTRSHDGLNLIEV